MPARAQDRLRIFFDGGCRPNPGPIEVAAVARGVAYIERGAGQGDSNDAEWLALHHAVRIAIVLGAGDVEFVGDSATVINQATGIAKCRGERLQAHRAAFLAAAAAIPRFRLRRVPRSKNLAGIALAQGHRR